METRCIAPLYIPLFKVASVV